MLSNDLLIVTGALVGSSGAILSYIMCRAMNRHFLSVIAGGFGTSGGSSAVVEGEVTPVTAEETAQLLLDAKNIMIIPVTAWQSHKPSIPSMKSPSCSGIKARKSVSASIRLPAVCPAT